MRSGSGSEEAAWSERDQDVDEIERSTRFLRPKGYVSPKQLTVLLALAIAPFLVITVRMLAHPGILSPGSAISDHLRAIGHTLNYTFALAGVRKREMDQVFFLLFLPTAAMLIAFARLTLGLRMFGFRSILLAMGFEEAGLIPSLTLVSLVVVVSFVLRPWLRQLRLPYYARVTVTFCFTVMVLVGLLILAPRLRSEMVWSTAFFPVLILALLAEGFGRTVEEDSILAALWRVGATIVMAGVIATVGNIMVIRETLFSYPELMLTQTVIIILIAEFLDFRLFEDFYARLSNLPVPRLHEKQEAYRIAVVRSRQSDAIIGWLGRVSPRRLTQRSVQPVVDALRAGGHTVRVFEGDTNLIRALGEFIPPRPRTGEPGGLVFNLAAGIQGDSHYTHVPSMLQASGVAYTGAAPQGHALAHDRYLARVLLRDAGVSTPAFRELRTPDDPIEGLRFPLVIKPRHASTYRFSVVERKSQLRRAVGKLFQRHGEPVLVEEYVDGREFQVCLLGNEEIECLPLVELDAQTREKTCPAELDRNTAEHIYEIARSAYRVSHCRDYARLNVRLDATGTPYLIEIDNHDILGRGGGFAVAAGRAGYSFEQLICRIVEIARARYVSLKFIAREEEAANAARPNRIRALLWEALGLSTDDQAAPGRSRSGS